MSKMNDSNKIELAEKEIEKAYKNSLEYINLKKIVEAIENDEECQTYLKQLKKLQKECRSKDTNLEEKRKIVKVINETKDKLHATPLWTNYISCKKEYDDMVYYIENMLNNM